MALGDLTKQLAEQALGSVTGSSKPAAPSQPQPESAGAVMLGQVQAMQKALKEEDELLVTVHAGAETLRVLECFAPSPSVVVLTGVDKDKNVTRLVAHVESLLLTCKVVRAHPPAKPVRIAFLAPRPRPE